MPNVNTTLTVVAAATAITVLSFAASNWSSPEDQKAMVVAKQETADKPAKSMGSARAASSDAEQKWAASATGRIEPKSGLIALAAEVPGQVSDVLVETNNKVFAGDLLVVIEDISAIERVAAAQSEIDVRMSEREEEPVTGLALERQKAADSLDEAEDAVFEARLAFDKAFKKSKSENASEYSVTTARDTYVRAKKARDEATEELKKVSEKAGMPLPTRFESSLAVARSDLAIAKDAFEKTRIRAPFDGTVLNVFVNEGEIVSPSLGRSLIAFGDVSKLRVRAEVEERDVANVSVGQKVVIRADAFPDREFTGTVSDIASALGAPRITTRGPRRPNDVDVLEVVADIDGSPALLAGMRVDVFFELVSDDAEPEKKLETGSN